MKRSPETTLSKFKNILILVFVCWSCSFTSVMAQEKTATTIGISYIQKADNTKVVTALVKAKNKENKFAPAQSVKVNFYFVFKEQQQIFDSTYTNKAGKAIVTLPANLPLDTGHYFSVIAKIEKDENYEDAEDEVHYKTANLHMELSPRDTSRTVRAIVTTFANDGKEIPVKDVEVKFYVQRLFGLLPAGEENTATTDENGIAAFVFPRAIPGDTSGALTVVARVEEHQQLGSVENKISSTWGSVLAKDPDPFPRTLWSAYAPIPLILTICILFGGVWITYFIIINMLVKIRRAGRV